MFVSPSGAVATATSGRANAVPPPVIFRGWSGNVPVGWRVIDLATHPSACVRFDLHAIYLGRPGDQQSCPSHISGRAEALLVEPVEDVTPSPDVRSATVAVLSLPSAAAAAQLVRIAIPIAGVTVTATWGSDRATVQRLLATARPAAGWRPALRSQPALRKQEAGRSSQPQARSGSSSRSNASAQPNSIVSTSGPFTGEAFDACAAPSLTTMFAWLNSPYRAVGIYIGGLNRACAQPNLTTDWVAAVTGLGWRLVPIYVGRQAPAPLCRCLAIDPTQASYEGRIAAEDAVANAQTVGIGPGAALFNDMEEYPGGQTNSAAVVTFLSAWTARLHELGYQSGVYAGVGSGLRDLTAITPYSGFITQPDIIWYPRWDGRDQTTGDPGLAPDKWTHQRLHQYFNGTSAWGGITMNIDRSAVDATLSGAPPPPPPPPPPPTRLAVAPELARALVIRAYSMILGRRPNPTQTNVATWTISFGAPRESFLNRLLSSQEWAARWTSIEYWRVLHRAPDTVGGPAWTSWLLGPGQPDLLAAQLAASPERWNQSGGNATTYVHDLYRDILGRGGSTARMSYFTDWLRAGASRLEVALQFTTGLSRVNQFITDAYVGFLGRNPDPAGRAYWSSVFQKDFDPATVLIPIAASAEAITKL